MSAPLLSVRGLTKHFRLPSTRVFGKGRVLRAVDGVDFDAARGEVLGLVGESGCGKTTAARLILRLMEATSGEVHLDDVDVFACSKKELMRLRREMQIVFQDPLSSLSPRMSVGMSIAEPLKFHGIGNPLDRFRRARNYLEVVGLDKEHFDRLPHEFSGGQTQRVAIARALILRPKLVILDEPVSALDVSIQSQILQLLMDLRAKFGLTYILISHDLSVVKRICDRTAVLYLGKIVELAESERLYREPLHPYTQALISAVPRPRPESKRVRQLSRIEGDVPSPDRPADRLSLPHALPAQDGCLRQRATGVARRGRGPPCRLPSLQQLTRGNLCRCDSGARSAASRA